MKDGKSTLQSEKWENIKLALYLNIIIITLVCVLYSSRRGNIKHYTSRWISSCGHDIWRFHHTSWHAYWTPLFFTIFNFEFLCVNQRWESRQHAHTGKRFSPLSLIVDFSFWVLSDFTFWTWFQLAVWPSEWHWRSHGGRTEERSRRWRFCCISHFVQGL